MLQLMEDTVIVFIWERRKYDILASSGVFRDLLTLLGPSAGD